MLARRRGWPGGREDVVCFRRARPPRVETPASSRLPAVGPRVRVAASPPQQPIRGLGLLRATCTFPSPPRDAREGFKETAAHKASPKLFSLTDLLPYFADLPGCLFTYTGHSVHNSTAEGACVPGRGRNLSGTRNSQASVTRWKVYRLDWEEERACPGLSPPHNKFP